jgi:hypothetical protein
MFQVCNNLLLTLIVTTAIEGTSSVLKEIWDLDHTTDNIANDKPQMCMPIGHISALNRKYLRILPSVNVATLSLQNVIVLLNLKIHFISW